MKTDLGPVEKDYDITQLPHTQGDNNMVATETQFNDSDLMWDVDDQFSSVRCVKVRDPRTNEETGFGMVYGKNEEGVYEPVRPVSERYHPIDLDSILAIAQERFEGIDIDGMITRTDRAGTIVRCRIPIGDRVKLADLAFDTGTDFAPNSGDVKGELIQRSLEITNSYCGVTGVRTLCGWLRLICTNGIVAMDGIQAKNIHTVHEVGRHLETLATASYEGQVETIQKMFTKKLTKAQINVVKKMLPKKRHEALDAYLAIGDHTAYAAYGFVSYLQSHEYTVSRAGQLDKPMRAIAKMAA